MGWKFKKKDEYFNLKCFIIFNSMNIHTISVFINRYRLRSKLEVRMYQIRDTDTSSWEKVYLTSLADFAKIFRNNLFKFLNAFFRSDMQERSAL